MSVLQRAVQLLDVLQTADEGLSIRQIGERAELSKSAVQRILRELVETGLVVQDSTTRRYELGPRLLALSATYHRRLNVRQVALGHMTRLRDETGETVGLTIRTGEQIMHIEQAESPRDLRASFEIGQRLPLWSGAPSRLFLADTLARERFSAGAPLPMCSRSLRRICRPSCARSQLRAAPDMRQHSRRPPAVSAPYRPPSTTDPDASSPPSR